MNLSASKFLGRLISADYIYSLEQCFAFLLSDLSEEALNNNNSAVVFDELWGWYCGGTEDGVWQYYEKCRRDKLKQISVILRHFGCEQLSRAYLRGAEVLFPLLDGEQTEENHEKIMQFSDKLDSYIDEYRIEILTALKDCLVQNFEELADAMSGNALPDMLFDSEADEPMSYSEMMKQAEDEMFAEMGITREEAVEADRRMREESYHCETGGKYSEKLAEELKKHTKNAVFAAFDKGSEISRGCSKTGGSPDVPKDFEWFRSSEGTPLTFLMQINFAELHAYDRDGIFPEKGLLYFFYDVEQQPWYWDEGGYKAFYYGGDASETSPAEFPEECCDLFDYGCADENCVIDECRLKFFADMTLPSYEEYCEIKGVKCDYSGFDDYDATVRKMLGYVPAEYSDKYNIIGGYSVPEQDSPAGEFGDEYIQLMQMTYYESDKCGFMFGDGGKLYFYIRKDELAAGNFDDVRFVLQCG